MFFAFRVDTEVPHEKHIVETLKVAEEYSIKMTWFMCMEEMEKQPDIIMRLAETQDIQSHGYLHETYHSVEKNYNNIALADESLRKMGIEPVGFAAPFGIWNESLGTALDKTNYVYSSEFYNSSFPFYYKHHKTLQVPIFPVCLGNLLMLKLPINRIKKYYLNIIEYFCRKNEPMFLYCHPDKRLGKYPEVLKFIMNEVVERGIKITTLTDYAKEAVRKKSMSTSKAPTNI